MTGRDTPSAPASRQRWIIGPWADFSVFIATPLAIVPAFHLLMSLASLSVLKLGILGVSATGHHLPGMIRAYSDRSIFNRFRLRLILVPALFILMTALTAYYRLSLTIFILIVWSTWHGSMQILGFLRIYDVKAGFKSAITARLDYWMCLSWFIQVVLWSPSRKTSVLSSFYMAGGPLVSAPAARIFETVWLILTVAVTAAYAGQALYNFSRHRYLNVPKLLCLASGVGFWAYCLIAVDNLIIGLILWEIFHDLQYNVFVWDYNRNRVDRNLSQSGMERFLFRMNWRKISFYAACIIAYGCLGLMTRDMTEVYPGKPAYANLFFQIGNVFAASALIHFYLDGFIWKVRDGKVQQDLGVTAGDGFRKRPKALHGFLLALFFGASGSMAYSEYRHANSPGSPDRPDNLADLIPESGYANFMKASRLKTEGRFDSAIHYYELAIRFDTSYGFSHAFIADLKSRNGNHAGAIPHYEKALILDPESPMIRENLAGLYLHAGDFAKAKDHYQALSVRDPMNAEYHFQIAWCLLQMKKGAQAKPFLETALRLDPAQPKAWNYLGMVEQARGNLDSARRLYRKSLALDSTYGHARENLAASVR